MKGYFDTAPPPHTHNGVENDWYKQWCKILNLLSLKRNHSRETNSSNNSRKRWATIKSCVDKCWEHDKTHKAPKHAATAEVFSKLLLMSLVAVYFSLNVEGKPTPNTCTHKLLKTSSLVSKLKHRQFTLSVNKLWSVATHISHCEGYPWIAHAFLPSLLRLDFSGSVKSKNCNYVFSRLVLRVSVGNYS